MKELESILRADLCSFIEKTFHTLNPNTKYLHNWHIEEIAEKLEAVTQGKIRRLIINMPPRYLKSICASVAWPAWLLGKDPSRRVIVASHNAALATKHSLDTRKVMQTSWYQKIFPQMKIARDQNEKIKFMTSEFGFRMAASVGAGITGEGGNFLIVDDPISAFAANSDHERAQALNWFDQTFSTRLDDKKHGAIIVVMQRLHDEDLSGVLLRRGGWEHLNLPVFEDGKFLHEEREGEAEIQRLKENLGEYGFAAQYMQAPHKTEGGLIRRSWLQFYESNQIFHTPCYDTGSKIPQQVRDVAAGKLSDFTKTVYQSWDTAIKCGDNSDYSVCMTFAEMADGYYLLDVFRDKLSYPELKRAMIAQALKWNPQAVLVEDKASGQSLIQDLRAETTLPIIAQMPTMDKVSRIASVSPMIEAGKLKLPKHETWYQPLEAELLSFPKCKHDDQVDALSQFLSWIRNRQNNYASIRIL